VNVLDMGQKKEASNEYEDRKKMEAGVETRLAWLAEE
jgi:hypothetical protein